MYTLFIILGVIYVIALVLAAIAAILDIIFDKDWLSNLAKILCIILIVDAILAIIIGYFL